ncbi:ATP-binding cassette sub-family C member Sur [Neocloeon triangulifer]|uniref:ATP-binding cassette sub-family C member Sur n=1 Tax=Neocloeon triangulifer TaxID=2078957 RepID=UPI00286EFE61|nr:ATP-binding cassette sub-family C member Sur [Neocloeon triangulifer]
MPFTWSLDCCLHTLLALLSTLLVAAASKVCRPDKPSRWSKSRLVLACECCRSGAVLTGVLVGVVEASEAIVLAFGPHPSWAANLALVGSPLATLALFSAATFCVPTCNSKTRVLVLCVWLGNAAARGVQLHGLLSEQGLSAIRHVRAATASLATLVFCTLAALETTLVLNQRLRSAEYKRAAVEAKEGEEGEHVYGHSTASLASQATFWWLTPLLCKGAEKPLELSDLGKLPKEESTEASFSKFNLIYNQQNQEQNGSLWRCYARFCWAKFALGGVFKLLGDLVGLAGPLGISVIVAFVQTADKRTPQTQYLTLAELFANGYVMGFVVLVASLAQGTFSQASTHLVNVEGIHLKAALQALVYAKSLRLAPWSFKEAAEGSAAAAALADPAAVTNLMSEDAYNVMSCVWIGHYVWAIPLKIAVIMWLLHGKLGWSAVISAALCIVVMTPLQLLVGKRMSANSKHISEASDERLKKMNETIQGIKLIKLYSWEHEFCKRILGVRATELRLLDNDSLYWGVMMFLTHASSAMVTLVTFVAYLALEETPLTAADVFSALALFNQLTVPLFIFPVTVPIVIGAVVSTNRLRHFLALPEISQDKKKKDDPEPEPAEISSRVFDAQTAEAGVGAAASGLCDSSDSVFGPAGLDNIDEDEEDAEAVCGWPAPRAGGAGGAEVLVSVAAGSAFAWHSDAAPSLLVADKIELRRGTFTLVVGPVGSGKTSLLSALLAEMHTVDGAVTWHTKCDVAYAAQKPWLLNATLRDNILFGSQFNARRYSKVLAACALEPDVAILPAGDLTPIGEKGISLSGGQRQRVAVARALYSRASLVLLDDPLSALDAHVGQHVVEAGMRRLLLRRQGRTVLLVTHRLQLLHLADHIVVMHPHGALRIQGSLNEIERMDPELVSEWRTAMSRQDEHQKAARGRTARERWQLVRLVSRIGSQLRQKVGTPDATWQSAEEPPVPSSVFVPFRRRTFTNSLSRRHLSHDFPLPIDECGDEFVDDFSAARSAPPTADASSRLGRGFSVKRAIFRTVSLQGGSRKRSSRKSRGSLPQLQRQMSSPTMQPSASIKLKNFDGAGGVNRQGSFFKRIFTNASQRTVAASVSNDAINGPVAAAKEKNVFRRLISSTSSFRSSVSASEVGGKPVVRRLASSTSAFSDDFNDDDDIGGESVENEEDEVTLEEEREYGKVARRVYLSYLRASGTTLGCSYLVSAVAWQVCRVLTDYWLSEWTNSTDQKNKQLDSSQMKEYMAVYAGLSVLSIVLSVGSNALGQVAGARARRVVHQRALHSVMRSPMKFFEATPVGHLINRFAMDMAIVDKKIAIAIQRLIQFLLLCLSAILVNVAVSPWFIFLAVPICAVYYWVQKFYRTSARELQRLDSMTRSPIFSHFAETLGGLQTIRAFGQQARFTSMLNHKMDTHRNAFLILNSSNRWLGVALDYLGGVIVFAAVLTALLSAHLLPHVVTPALVGLAVNYTLLVPIYLNWVVKFLADMEMYMTAVERLDQYARLPQEDYKDHLEASVPKQWPHEGHIKFQGVSLRYDVSREPVLAKLDLDIPAGQKLGICGRTGSGKSSLAMSLFGMVEAFEGRLLIDGLDVLKDVPLSTLRSRLSAIPQDAIMFGGSLRDNLDPRADFSDAQLWDALDVAQMKTVASNLPGGLDGEVKEGGENFSAGQRQLFCLARAVLHGASCLVLDEATSSLDAATEQRLLVAAAHAFNTRTVITIAHRLVTLLKCDRVVVLSGGKVVEDASPTELLSRPTSLFSEMLHASEEGSLL